MVTRFFEKFSIPNGMDPTVQVISELFLPDSFLARVAKCSNLYGRSKGHSFKPISAPNILVFFSIIFYMGVARLPAKTDYWNSNTPSPANKQQRINPSKPCLPIERLHPPPWMTTSILFQKPEALVSTAAF